MNDRNEWRWFVRGECLERSSGVKLLTLTRCHSCGFHRYMKLLCGGGDFSGAGKVKYFGWLKKKYFLD